MLESQRKQTPLIYKKIKSKDDFIRQYHKTAKNEPTPIQNMSSHSILTLAYEN